VPATGHRELRRRLKSCRSAGPVGAQPSQIRDLLAPSLADPVYPADPGDLHTIYIVCTQHLHAAGEGPGHERGRLATAITLFTLTMAALMIPGSKLTDIWGHKLCFSTAGSAPDGEGRRSPWLPRMT
jgi:MFS family permease